MHIQIVYENVSNKPWIYSDQNYRRERKLNRNQNCTCQINNRRYMIYLPQQDYPAYPPLHGFYWIYQIHKSSLRKHCSYIVLHRTNQINTTGATYGTGINYPSGVHIRFIVGFVLFVLFLLVIVLSVIFRFTASDYPFDLFKLFVPFWTIWSHSRY